MTLLQHNTFYLTCPGAACVATLTAPLEGVRGLLLVAPPLVEERKALVLPLVEAARLLAAEAGFAVLRVDYPGTGDAPGTLADFGPADAIAALGAAAEELSARFPGRPLAGLGVRTGAALLAASPHPAVRAAPKVFWDPVDGAESLRQWLQRHMVNDMMAYGHARVTRRALEEAWRAGVTVDLDGFGVTGAHAAALSTLALAPPEAKVDVLVAGRPSPATEKWADASGGRIEIVRLQAPPYWNSVGYVDTSAFRAATARWLTDNLPALPEGGARSPGEPPSAKDGARSPGEPPSGAGEHFVALPGGEGTLRGVLTLPAGAPRRTVLFLGGWSGDRQGPHRLFLEQARRLAGQGAASLRFDYRGRGESDGAHDAAGIATMADDALRAADWLRANGFAPEGLDVIAICSGCKVAVTLATRTDIRRMDLLSAETMGSLRARGAGWAKTAAALRAYARKLLRRETWRKLLRGDVHTDMVGKALVRHETRSAEEAKAEDRTLARFASYRGSLAFIYGGSDPDAPAAEAAYRRFCRRHGLRATFDIIPHAGHSYYALGWTARVLALLDR